MPDAIESVDIAGVHGAIVLNPDGTAIGTPVGGATSANQTNGTQKTQIVDAGGEAVTVTGGKLDVNATASLAGEAIPATGATTAVGVQIVDGSGNQITSFGGGTQYTEGDTDATLTGTVAMVEGSANTVLAMTQPLTDTQLRATAVPISAAALPLPSGAATETTLDTFYNVAESELQALNSSNSSILSGLGSLATQSTLASIETSVQVLDNAISGNEMQVDVVAALPAGTDAIGNVGLIPRTTGGLTIFRSIDIDESEEEVKATAGQLFSITAFNTTAAPLYLKFYNATAANVTVGTTTPVLTYLVPANADSDGAGFVWNNDIGLAFGTAITVACTTGIADSDTGAPGANACLINLGYM